MSVNSHHKKFCKPHKKRPSSIDKLVYLAVILGPMMTLPQLYSIWVERSDGVSVISWISYLVVAVIWLIYGIKQRDKPIVMVQLIWIVLDIFIVVGLLR